jgi:hypothetical protein
MRQKKENPKQEKEITRKEALRKAGKYVAFTAATAIIMLTPNKSQAVSTPVNRGRGY